LNIKLPNLPTKRYIKIVVCSRRAWRGEPRSYRTELNYIKLTNKDGAIKQNRFKANS
jgi:hypothetical protein